MVEACGDGDKFGRRAMKMRLVEDGIVLESWFKKIIEFFCSEFLISADRKSWHRSREIKI